MKNTRFDAEFDDFYRKCLLELQSRPNWTDAFVPQLERFVLVSMKLAKLNSELVNTEITQQHTNKADHTNEVTSSKWRMFIMLNREANALAKDLKLSPHSAPVSDKKGKKGFDLGNDKMKIA